MDSSKNKCRRRDNAQEEQPRCKRGKSADESKGRANSIPEPERAPSQENDQPKCRRKQANDDKGQPKCSKRPESPFACHRGAGGVFEKCEECPPPPPMRYAGVPLHKPVNKIHISKGSTGATAASASKKTRESGYAESLWRLKGSGNTHTEIRETVEHQPPIQNESLPHESEQLPLSEFTMQQVETGKDAGHSSSQEQMLPLSEFTDQILQELIEVDSQTPPQDQIPLKKVLLSELTEEVLQELAAADSQQFVTSDQPSTQELILPPKKFRFSEPAGQEFQERTLSQELLPLLELTDQILQEMTDADSQPHSTSDQPLPEEQILPLEELPLSGFTEQPLQEVTAAVVQPLPNQDQSSSQDANAHEPSPTSNSNQPPPQDQLLAKEFPNSEVAKQSLHELTGTASKPLSTSEQSPTKEKKLPAGRSPSLENANQPLPEISGANEQAAHSSISDRPATQDKKLSTEKPPPLESAQPRLYEQAVASTQTLSTSSQEKLPAEQPPSAEHTTHPLQEPNGTGAQPVSTANQPSSQEHTLPPEHLRRSEISEKPVQDQPPAQDKLPSEQLPTSGTTEQPKQQDQTIQPRRFYPLKLPARCARLAPIIQPYLESLQLSSNPPVCPPSRNTACLPPEANPVVCAPMTLNNNNDAAPNTDKKGDESETKPNLDKSEPTTEPPKKKCDYLGKFTKCCCQDYSWVFWLFIVLGTILFLILILWKGCCFPEYALPSIGVFLTLGYFLLFVLICVTYIFCKDILKPANPQRNCSCKEIKIVIQILCGGALAFYLQCLRFPEYPSAPAPRTSPGRIKTKRTTNSTEPAETCEKHCITYCLHYTITILLLGVIAFVIFSLERRMRRRRVDAEKQDENKA